MTDQNEWWKKLPATFPRSSNSTLSAKELSEAESAILTMDASRHSPRGMTVEEIMAVTGLSSEDVTELAAYFRTL